MRRFPGFRFRGPLRDQRHPLHSCQARDFLPIAPHAACSPIRCRTRFMGTNCRVIGPTGSQVLLESLSASSFRREPVRQSSNLSTTNPERPAPPRQLRRGNATLIEGSLKEPMSSYFGRHALLPVPQNNYQAPALRSIACLGHLKCTAAAAEKGQKSLFCKC